MPAYYVIATILLTAGIWPQDRQSSLGISTGKSVTQSGLGNSQPDIPASRSYGGFQKRWRINPMFGTLAAGMVVGRLAEQSSRKLAGSFEFLGKQV